jgi:hypothetical protein
MPLRSLSRIFERKTHWHLDLVRFQPIPDLTPDLDCAVAALAEDCLDAAAKVRRD